MTEPSHDNDRPAPDDLNLKRFEAAPDDYGLSLDELSDTFARLIGRGEDPYAGDAPPPTEAPQRGEPPHGQETPADEAADPQAGDVSPRSILEAMLFVGHPQNVPLGSTQVAALMRGVTAGEIHDLVAELNEIYNQMGCAFEIKAVAGGYQMAIRPRFASLRDKFYGKIRQARLSQAAIDVLAIVAYNQPIGRQDVQRLRGKPSGGILRQLVRRELLQIERKGDPPRTVHYRTTDRFLDLFGLASLEDLPQSQELDRTM